MDDQLWKKADELLGAALELPVEECAGFIARAADGDGELAELVHRLLGYAEESGGDLVPGLQLDPALAQDFLQAEEERYVSPPGTVIGRYRLLGELGRGGMAVVHRAERVDGDFEQQMALKQLLGPASDELVERLEQERQILARATHPDMARLLDGGVDADGRPYLVMELAEGEPIDAYCDHQRLTVRQRLDLFLRIAHAVQYAHRNLVVHCDIKPSNVLVTVDGHPKLLDFGIARLLAEADAEPATALTRHGARPMTPAYASPEQVRGEPLTTLSDVYQLGLLLYVLLTGRSPYRQESSRSPLELARRISEEPPAQPHKAILDAASELEHAGDGTTVERIAHQRRTTPGRLVKQLRGDLGSIVLMALRKEPERRYASVALLIDDIERHLAGRTVAARPDSLWYRARTFTRRHRIAVFFAGLLLVALVAFSAVTAVQSRRIAEERDRANREAAVAAEVADFLTDLFRVADPSEARGNTVTAREILDRGSAEIDQRLAEPSLVRARLKRTMGRVFENLGLHGEARPLYDEALATAVEIGGEDSLEAVAAQADQGRLLMRLGLYDEAERLIRAALEAHRRLLGEEHPQTLDVAGNLATLRLLKGHPEEAATMNQQILAARRRVQGPDHLDTLGTANNLASTLFNLGRLEEVESLYREIYTRLAQSQGADHPRTLTAASNLGSVLIQLERFAEAEPLLRDTIEQRRKVLGEDHPGTLTAESNLAGLLADRGDHAEAEALYRRVHERRVATAGPDHPRVFDALYDVAWVVSLDPDRQNEAAALYRDALTGHEKTRGPDHPFTLDTLYALAVVEAKSGEDELALGHLREALERGYDGKKLLDEPAFAPLAERPEMRAIKALIGARSSSDNPYPVSSTD